MPTIQGARRLVLRLRPQIAVAEVSVLAAGVGATPAHRTDRGTAVQAIVAPDGAARRKDLRLVQTSASQVIRIRYVCSHWLLWGTSANLIEGLLIRRTKLTCSWIRWCHRRSSPPTWSNSRPSRKCCWSPCRCRSGTWSFLKVKGGRNALFNNVFVMMLGKLNYSSTQKKAQITIAKIKDFNLINKPFTPNMITSIRWYL